VPEKTIHNDKELFALIATGDEPAFENLFHAYVPRLQPLIASIVNSEIVAKDIIQEVFLSLWLNRHKLPDIQEPSNWIFKITYNKSYSFLRRQVVALKANEIITERLGTASLNGTEESLAFAETARVIQQAVQELPERSRTIYKLSREQGLKISEIADDLNISTQSVKNSLYRSGQVIKDHLAKQGIIVPLVLLIFFQ
jgi:RNA polymerase sigma-70 factor (ECF subfamily)